MAAREEILLALKMLVCAYPDRAPGKESYEVYFSALSDVPGIILQSAVGEHIRSSMWFPKVSELYQRSLRIAGVHRFEAEVEVNFRDLLAEQIELQAAFARGEPLDERLWRTLADKFLRLGYDAAAERTLKRLAHYQAAEAQDVGAQQETGTGLAASSLLRPRKEKVDDQQRLSGENSSDHRLWHAQRAAQGFEPHGYCHALLSLLHRPGELPVDEPVSGAALDRAA
jgi:hypothetical protein